MTELKWQVQLSPEAWEKMWTYVDLLKGEVACFGYTELDELNKVVYVPEIFLVPQTASAAEVDFLTEGLPYAIEKALTEGRIDDLRFCVHSHGEFAANWSSTDEDMLRKIGSTGTPWFVSAIFNRKNASTARIDIYGDAGPFGRTQHVLKDLEIVVERDPDYTDARLAELDAFVTIPQPVAKNVGYIKPAVKALNRPAGTNTTPANHGKPDLTSEDVSYPCKMVDEDTVVLRLDEDTSITVDLSELSAGEIMSMAQALEWGWMEDDRGDRYYYESDRDDGSELFYCVKAERFSPTWDGNAAESDYAEVTF